MAIEASSVWKNLGRPAYLLAALLVVLPLADFINNVWPLQMESSAWRYASEGLLSGSSLSLALGVVIAAATAVGREERRLARWIAVIAALMVLGTLVIMADFALNAVELRASLSPHAPTRQTYDMGTARVIIKLLLVAWVFGWTGLVLHRWGRGRRHASPASPPLVSARRGSSGSPS